MPPPQPTGLGLVNGKLNTCPESPNCVSSESIDAQHQVAPLPFSGSADAALQQVIDVVGAMPRTQLITQKNNYLHFECRSLLFRFVDDLEFYVDPERHVIQVRSASRVGYSDLGVNRKRVEKVREALLAEGL